MKKYRPHLFCALLALSGAIPGLALAAPAKALYPVPQEARIPTDGELLSMGFIDVKTLDPEILVELKYASVNNFMGSDVYAGLNKAYLRKEAATKLARANRYLKELRPELTLLVADALRPRSISRKMWAHLSGSPMQRYVANPKGGSIHNYGCAVDITIADRSGRRLDMGTPIDFFGPLAEPRHEKMFLLKGKLTPEQVENRRLLRKVMTGAGFYDIQLEWWHFEAFDKKRIRKAYSIVE